MPQITLVILSTQHFAKGISNQEEINQRLDELDAKATLIFYLAIIVLNNILKLVGTLR